MVTSTLKFDSIAQSFLNYCAIERGLSANTVSAYRRDLEKFQIWLSSTPVAEIDTSTIADFEANLRVLKFSPASINRIESTLRTFFKHVQQEHGLNNPTIDIVSSKSKRRLPKALQIDQVISLINAAFHEGQPITIRDRTIIELLYSSGARVSELMDINISDINVVASDDGDITTVKLRGKGGKERIVPLGSFATKAIDDYLIRVRPMLAAKNAKVDGAFFLNARGTRLTRQTAWNIVLKAAEVAGVSEAVSPHVFRHSYATHLLDGGADIRVVQELLGHASVTTTQIYTLITIDKVRESYRTAHPRA
jgi:integrase/recombinase XerD